jgi:hypothetical protein
MSSARKRAAIQKANNEAEFLRQRLMRAEHHANVMQGFAEVAARRSDALFAALKRIADGPWPDECEGPEEQCRFDEAVAREAIAKVGAGDTVPMGSNLK